MPRLPTVCSVLCLGILLVACGGGGGDATPAAPAQLPSTAAPESPSAPETPAAQSSPVSGSEDSDAFSDADDTAEAESDLLDAATRRLLDSLSELALIALSGINRTITEGRPDNDASLRCVADFDAAQGWPVSELICRPAMSLADGRLGLDAGSVVVTPECQADLLAGTAERPPGRCEISVVRLTVNTRFIVAETGVPQPTTGGDIHYHRDDARLTIENDPQALTGRFFCEINLLSGLATDESDPYGNCATQIDALQRELDAAIERLSTTTGAA